MFTPSEFGGGLNKTSSWTDAYSKAKSFIIVSYKFTFNAYQRVAFAFIPKDEVSTSDLFFVGTGGSFTSINLFTQARVTTSSIINYVLANGDDITSTATIKYYYD